jgi:tRNA nucleotidyltransferase (CCA-adding enzyme)
VDRGAEAALQRSARGRNAAGLSWEHYAHGADVGVRGRAPTKAQAFEQAALALTAVLVDPARVRAHEAVDMTCEAPDDELLLAEWLNALVYEMATRRMLFSRFAVRIDGARLAARAWGEPVDPARHQPAVEVKGATYTTLRVAPESGGWVAQTVLDV